ncbi:MAG: hypothetical protein HFH62_02085 [Lachnospiraceae bacterium]|nr:hypothetical protein [Lachnospiraceae bacterium]
MAFWNRRKKKRMEEEEALLEQQAREKLDALREQKREARNRDGEKEADKGIEPSVKNPDLYEREVVKPVYSDDRKRYVTDCCEAIREAEKQIGGIRGEYQEVTDSLLDIQKIDRIQGEERKQLLDYGKNIVRLTRERSQYKNRNLSIPEAVIRRFEPYEDDLVDEIKRMYETENYQKLIEGDLEKLHQEKRKIRQEKREIVERQNALKKLAKLLIFLIISMFALFVAAYYTLKADMTFPYLATVLLAAISATVIFVESNRNRKSMTLADRKMDKAILLLNRVKIKCVNNLNVLEYDREKFGVRNGAEFEQFWNEYCKVKEYERKFRENTEQLNYYCDALVTLLRQQGLKDSEVWTGQVLAIVDDREMVEIRHELNARRQILRERIEYNENVKADCVKQIDQLVAQQPEHREEILKIVEQYSDKKVDG